MKEPIKEGRANGIHKKEGKKKGQVGAKQRAKREEEGRKRRQEMRYTAQE
jgi:hypothetical protein